MLVEIDVPDYSPEHGLRMKWEPDSRIVVEVREGVTLISANRDGLVSLARLLLTLADPEVPPGNHWHLDELNSLEPGSSELIVEKL